MASKTTAYRREAEEVLKDLGEAELRVARDFLKYLRDKKPDAATREILRSPQLVEDARGALADRRAGRSSRFKSWDKVKRQHV